MQEIIYTTLPQAAIIKGSFHIIHLFAPNFIPSPDTSVFQRIYKNSFTLSFDSWTTDEKVVRTSEYQLEIGSAVKVNSPKHLIAALQTAARSGFTNKAINVSVFNHVDVRKIFVEMDGTRDSVDVNYATNDHPDQYRDLKYEEYAKEPLLKPFIKHTDLKQFYPIQVIDLRFQVDHANPKKLQLFEEYRGNPDNAHTEARLFTWLIRCREL